jgi:hypothetical protein
MAPKKIAVFVGMTSLFGAGGGVVATELERSKTTTIVQTVAAAPQSSKNVAERTMDTLTPSQIYKKTKDSVAYITAQVTQQSSSPFGPQSQSRPTG